MTFADQLRQEGFQQGIQEGMKQVEKQLHLIAEKLIAKGVSPAMIAEITDLPITVIEKLSQPDCI